MPALLRPTFAEEKLFQERGYQLIAGIDEVGRGALAGPVAAAAVILPLGLKAVWLKQVRDSKQLSPEKREVLSQNIREVAVSIGIGMVSHEVIDKRGIVKATQMAMRLAVRQLTPPAEALLIDYFRLPGVRLPQKGVPDGDSLCISIACASIVAKVSRDHLMVELDATYQGYGLANHKGYGTEEHLICLRRLGPSLIHRRSFKPVKITGEED
ncbi:MAG TPA: ribonuclease HII [Dehalococcoidales bacterium]|nr:ribonuclease HII [Dehalococcoidales bacterium]